MLLVGVALAEGGSTSPPEAGSGPTSPPEAGSGPLRRQKLASHWFQMRLADWEILLADWEMQLADW